MPVLRSRGFGRWKFTLATTDDELVISNPFGTRRIPRAQIAFARFEYLFPGRVRLRIHRHDGSHTDLLLSPKWTSSELSGDPAPRDSLAYKITEWARSSAD
ncbi:PH (Pleckstrin Homology) domain-containing protein [Kribbella voronezhensis]|uniref:PH (Pleckstrin Homology) domain-containing protein n=1 Tax=Kribbella voronezhensis TaxID=2512212 RepID=A0A4R7TGC1_9ACTN|nr:PH domain-containing protein [Kribbella voronezhensis]TDU91332.1 PH (Pleckstrin Homology) domain-containing protein [Kribbella voronezhensis]